MPKLQASEFDANHLTSLLRAKKRLHHLRVRRRGELLILESGPDKEVTQHVRFRRVPQQWWCLEMATHNGRWEATPFRDGLAPLLNQLVESFPWTIAPG